ncbi:MarR family transcriptional regulator [Microbacterium oxydans]|uniref:MarR family winged helix-turn-helix transcriptional regulator n=1 Tax=Microbacterium TaxID=33882 RepID=UPI0009EBB411|nr:MULTISPECIES: MarR family transcriptional regulator [Microbacterium]KAB1893682.1 MarR family transcriptional regulator [Microbacterium oxydans]GED38190.1 MarR family transcriptional regulator [Microbacterium oxydans]
MDSEPGTTPNAGAQESSPAPGAGVSPTGETPDGLIHTAIYDVEASDPRSVLIDRTGVPPEELKQIAQVMESLAGLREAEQTLSQASRRYMRLNETDMRALHYLIVCANRNLVATPGGIAHHLGVSTAATTKLLDRLEQGGHIARAPHPTDRRALQISITPETRHAAMETVGRQQAKRFYSAARLTQAEREVVIRFLTDMTEEITLRDEPWLQEGA